MQDRLIKELMRAGIRDIETANRWIKQVYMPDHNRRFAKPAELDGSAFVPVKDHAQLADILAVVEERVVGRDNTVGWGRLRLQLPESPMRHHYVKARVRVHQNPDGAIAIFHGPRCLARYDAGGRLIEPAAPLRAAA